MRLSAPSLVRNYKYHFAFGSTRPQKCKGIAADCFYHKHQLTAFTRRLSAIRVLAIPDLPEQLSNGRVKLRVVVGVALAHRSHDLNVNRSRVHLQRRAVIRGYTGVRHAQGRAVHELDDRRIDHPSPRRLAYYFAEPERPIAFGEFFGV